MSTRSQIGFYKTKETPLKKHTALIYRHSDGYPNAVLPDIIPFLRWWKSKRGINDLEYVSARLLQYLCNEYDGRAKEIEKEIGKTALSNDGDYTGIYGHGICNDFYGDIEYFYKIYPNGIQIYSCLFNKPTTQWRLLNTIDLDKEVDIEKVIAMCEKEEDIKEREV